MAPRSLEDARVSLAVSLPGTALLVPAAKALGAFRATARYCGDWELCVKLIASGGAAESGRSWRVSGSTGGRGEGTMLAEARGETYLSRTCSASETWPTHAISVWTSTSGEATHGTGRRGSATCSFATDPAGRDASSTTTSRSCCDRVRPRGACGCFALLRGSEDGRSYGRQRGLCVCFRSAQDPELRRKCMGALSSRPFHDPP